MVSGPGLPRGENFAGEGCFTSTLIGGEKCVDSWGVSLRRAQKKDCCQRWGCGGFVWEVVTLLQTP